MRLSLLLPHQSRILCSRVLSFSTAPTIRHEGPGTSWVLTFNCGSSSIKFQVVNPLTREVQVSGSAERLGAVAGEASLSVHSSGKRKKGTVRLPSQIGHEETAEIIAGHVKALAPDLAGIGHRVVHGGHKFRTAQIITDEVKASIRDCAVFAPLHNYNSLKGLHNKKLITYI